MILVADLANPAAGRKRTNLINIAENGEQTPRRRLCSVLTSVLALVIRPVVRTVSPKPRADQAPSVLVKPDLRTGWQLRVHHQDFVATSQAPKVVHYEMVVLSLRGHHGPGSRNGAHVAPGPK